MKKISHHLPLLTAACVPIVLAAAAALGQTNGGTGTGLDSLDEQHVMGDLASFKLTTLLDRDFESFKIPAAERESTLTIINLAQLVNGRFPHVADRRLLAVNVAKGFDSLLPKLTDPDKLMGYANDLFSSGAVPTITELEYFGDNPVSQAQLKPVAETVQKMYDQVYKLADAKIQVMANQINNANQNAILPKIAATRQTKLYGEYSKNRAAYALCISLPPNDPKLKPLADDTIKYLSQFANPSTGVEAQLRLQIGKLKLVSGNFVDAKTDFDFIVANADRKIKPAPEVFEQNDSRYFAIVAEIDAGNLKGAEADIPVLETWETRSYLPTLDAGGQQAVQAALQMLKFRLYSAQSDIANDVNEKKKANDQAIDVLAGLLKDQPGLKDLVFDQLVGRIPANPDYATLSPLVLEAIQEQGFTEFQKKEGEPFDKAKLRNAIPAAQELVNRRGKGVDDATATLSAYFIPYAHDKLEEKIEAATGFMDFAEKFPTDTTKATDSLAHAEAIVGELRKTDKENPDTRKLYDRFLPLAINAPYNEKRFAYGYASLLFQEKEFKKAVEYYKQVPDTDKYYPEAQYSQMFALAKELNDLPAGDERKQVVSQIMDLTEKVDGFYTDAKDDEAKKKYQDWSVVSDQIAADLSRKELSDPARSLKILDGLEGKIAGTKDEKATHLNVMRLRITDYMDTAKLDEATKTLVQLLGQDQVAGERLLFEVLQTVSREKDAAEAAGNTAELKKLASDQATLTGLVVDYASKHPEYASRLPGFRLYDADSKREVAELVDDPAVRKQSLEAALKQYQILHDQHADDLKDLAAQQGIGLTQYDLGNYAEAVKYLSPLVRDKKVGLPTEDVVENGVHIERENTQYWQANYELFRAALEQVKATPADPSVMETAQLARRQVVNLFIIYGNKTGGKKYHDDFVTLKDEMTKTLPAPKVSAKTAAPAPVKAQ